jgi:hypothetical protein
MLIVVVLVVDRANIQHFNPSHTASAKKLILICGLVAESKINKNKKIFSHLVVGCGSSWRTGTKFGPFGCISTMA